MREVVIVGGGVAGLSAAISSAEKGLKPLLIDAGHYPAHKICGEFLSPEILPLLESWGIHPPQLIKKYRLIVNEKQFSFELPSPAGGLSRYFLDQRLMQIAQEKGVEIMTDTMVKDLRYDGDSSSYCIGLSSGQEVSTSRLLIGAGRISRFLMPASHFQAKPVYYGFKAHFEGIDLEDRIDFYLFEGGYLGMSGIEEGKINVACLAKKEVVERKGSPSSFMEHLASHLDVLRGRKPLFPWMSCVVPEFGIKKTPDLPSAFFIGDAAGTIPPAAGDGLAIGLLSGQLVSEYAFNRDAVGYKRAWRESYGSAIQYGKVLHRILLNRPLTALAWAISSVAPLAPFLFTKTRSLEGVKRF